MAVYISPEHEKLIKKLASFTQCVRMLKDDTKKFYNNITDESTSDLIRNCLNQRGTQLQNLALQRFHNQLEKINFGDSNLGKFSAEVVKV